MRQDYRDPSISYEAPPWRQQLFSKVPEVTIFFWIIKVLATTVGETAADYLNETLGLGLSWTSLFMTGLFLITLSFQFRVKKYVPGIYWLAIVLISVVGTLITDNLTDNLHFPRVPILIFFAVALAVSFVAWYWSEKTLSIHSIYTTKREVFYWLVILFTFSLGTVAGDLLGESYDLGYLTSLLIFAGAIAVVVILHYVLKLMGVRSFPVLSFWIAYILTRPLGASLGDYLSQSDNDGLKLGTTVTSFIFLAAILITVIYLTVTKKDEIHDEDPAGSRA